MRNNARYITATLWITAVFMFISAVIGKADGGARLLMCFAACMVALNGLQQWRHGG